MTDYTDRVDKQKTIQNNLEASQVRLLTEYRKLCKQLQSDNGCYEDVDHCYSCDVHFKMNPLISELRLYDFEVRDV